MELSKEDYKIIIDSLIKASNSTETEWFNIEKAILETYHSISNENVSSTVQEMWNQLHCKVERAIKNMI